MPVAGFAFRTGKRRQIVRCYSALLTHLSQNVGQVILFIPEIINRVVSRRSKFASTVSQERPVAGPNDRCFVRPLLREFAGAIQETLEAFPVVGTESRPHDQEVRRDQHIDKVQL